MRTLNIIKPTTVLVIASTLLVACGGGGSGSATPVSNNGVDLSTPAAIANVKKLVQTNADIAYAAYTDAVITAEALKTALEDNLINVATPTAANLVAAKQAWLAAREPYGQTEVYRFRSTPINSSTYPNDSDDGPEGAINAWPLGEALIDYTTAGTDFLPAQLADVDGQATTIADADVKAGGTTIISSAFAIDSALLETTETSGRDVLAGYHAIEFLLWGQDLNNSDDSADTLGARTVGSLDADGLMTTAGTRPVSDYDGTTGMPQRRKDYLQVAVDKLVADLKLVQAGWSAGSSFRTAFETVTTEAEAKQRLKEILTGMGTLSEGELAGERIQIAFTSNSQEDEHSCFSDNTHRDIWLNAEGVSNSYFGDYAGYDSNRDAIDDVATNAVSGYGFDDLLADLGQAETKTQIEAALAATKTAYEAIDSDARTGKPFDVQVQDENRNSNSPVFKAIVALNAQAKLIAEAATTLGITGDVVDPEGSACDTASPTAECP